MITATISEAKTNLPELLKRAQEGETEIITWGRKTPVARLEAIHAVGKKRLAWTIRLRCPQPHEDKLIALRAP